ncbi:MAG: chorismate synthase [Flavobacteriales bacterium]|nr:chorismate synthase [Flavobacteriales bacterium]
MNSFGRLFKITTFGESHGPGIGIVIDGCPAGIELDNSYIQKDLNRRKPGQSKLTSPRNETDEFRILSGVFESKTTGAPIAIWIENKDVRPEDYLHLKDVFRPSHADYTYQTKYGHRDHRGGGSSSARVTAGWVAAGAIAKQILEIQKIRVRAYVKQVYNIKTEKKYRELDLDKTDQSSVRCPDPVISKKMESLIKSAAANGDSLGGVLSCVIEELPAGIGEPLFDKLNARIAQAMMSINAVKGIQFGTGFDIVNHFGSEVNDTFTSDPDGRIYSETNHSGGIQGGISNGMPVTFDLAFKPVASIDRVQNSVDKNGKKVIIQAKGRHDPCVLPRAVPIVEAMTAMVLADMILLKRSDRL